MQIPWGQKTGFVPAVSLMPRGCPSIKETHYMEDIALQDVAVAMNYSDAYFCKLFKQCFDKSFVSYLTWFRMEKAKEMLENGYRGSIQEVAATVGYDDAYHFSKLFKKHYGITPTQARKDA